MFKFMHVMGCRLFAESQVDSFLINLWCFINIRLISFVGVKIVKTDDTGAIVRLKVNRKN